MRLIDADALPMYEELFMKGINKSGVWVRYRDVENLIRNAPTIEEQKKGKWIKKMRIIETDKYASYNPEWYCSCCGKEYEPLIAGLINFCPNCGADMRGEQDD